MPLHNVIISLSLCHNLCCFGECFHHLLRQGIQLGNNLISSNFSLEEHLDLSIFGMGFHHSLVLLFVYLQIWNISGKSSSLGRFSFNVQSLSDSLSQHHSSNCIQTCWSPNGENRCLVKNSKKWTGHDWIKTLVHIISSLLSDIIKKIKNLVSGIGASKCFAPFCHSLLLNKIHELDSFIQVSKRANSAPRPESRRITMHVLHASIGCQLYALSPCFGCGTLNCIASILLSWWWIQSRSPYSSLKLAWIL
mmetsp:Transcript_34646/g.84009  ORF Transcript_34646/g.84009 Transcript_34646/m.84009 type:complete len:250 (-) Transcript_34646:1218-1967(-)